MWLAAAGRLCQQPKHATSRDIKIHILTFPHYDTQTFNVSGINALLEKAMLICHGACR